MWYNHAMDDKMKVYGLSEEEYLEFSAYIANRFENAEEITEPDESYLYLWDGICDYAKKHDAVAAINDKICARRPVEFHSPDQVEIEMFSSFAGRIPIIYVRDPDDFENLVTSVAYKGIRPEGLETTGASFVYGRLIRLIILSAKPYSNVPAAELGIDEKEWLEKSKRLRRGHECTHFYTRQIYGITNNILHDEIMADFIGMTEAFGFFRAEWFLRFMGIIPGSGKRLALYTKGLSPRACSAVKELLTTAAKRLEDWTHEDGFDRLTSAERIKYLCQKGLAGMAKDPAE